MSKLQSYTAHSNNITHTPSSSIHIIHHQPQNVHLDAQLILLPLHTHTHTHCNLHKYTFIPFNLKSLNSAPQAKANKVLG